MESENNPYQTPNNEQQFTGLTGIFREKATKVFNYSYFTSLAVAITVVPIWLFVLFSSTPPGQRRTSPPDVLEMVFILLTTLPSFFSCLAFSIVYCFIVRMHTELKIWPAVLFGAISGFAFNAMTAIAAIERFFDW